MLLALLLELLALLLGARDGLGGGCQLLFEAGDALLLRGVLVLECLDSLLQLLLLLLRRCRGSCSRRSGFGSVAQGGRKRLLGLRQETLGVLESRLEIVHLGLEFGVRRLEQSLAQVGRTRGAGRCWGGVACGRWARGRATLLGRRCCCCLLRGSELDFGLGRSLRLLDREAASLLGGVRRLLELLERVLVVEARLREVGLELGLGLLEHLLHGLRAGLRRCVGHRLAHLRRLVLGVDQLLLDLVELALELGHVLLELGVRRLEQSLAQGRCRLLGRRGRTTTSRLVGSGASLLCLGGRGLGRVLGVVGLAPQVLKLPLRLAGRLLGRT